MSSLAVSIAIIGIGGVGKAFVDQLAEYASKHHEKPLRVVYVSRSKSALISRDYSGLDLGSSLYGNLESSGEEPLGLSSLVQFLSNSPGESILVDNTSSTDVAAFYPHFLSSGTHIATPNKKGFSSEEQLWKEICASSRSHSGKGGYIFHESTVGAGLPVISTLKELIETGDEIKKIEGVFSGTMSFLFNEFAPVGEQSNKKFSDVVKVAKDAGYTEPDPRDDLNGLDVARKLTILGRLSGLSISSPTSFPVESLIPKPLESVSTADEFLQGLPNHDSDIGNLNGEAAKEGKVIRFVGSIDIASKSLKVGLEKFNVSHPIAALKGSDNIIAFYTKRYGDRALIIQGAGAGTEVTAMGVLGDVIKILNLVKK